VVHEDGRHQRARHIISLAGIASRARLIRFPHGDNPSFLNAKAWSRMYNQKGFAGSLGWLIGFRRTGFVFPAIASLLWRNCRVEILLLLLISLVMKMFVIQL